MAEIKAIETQYKGYRFRSRLEARWAVFFDALGIEYQYEPEGFDLGAAGAYLPDFYLPGLGCWIEVKGFHGAPGDDKEGWSKASALCEFKKQPVFMLFGDLHSLQCRPPNFNVTGSNRGWLPHGYGFPNEYYDTDSSSDSVRFIDGCVEWAECPLCSKIGIDLHGQFPCGCRCDGPFVAGKCSRCTASEFGRKREWHDPWRNSESNKLGIAYATARSARFEHGESPNVGGRR